MRDRCETEGREGRRGWKERTKRTLALESVARRASLSLEGESNVCKTCKHRAFPNTWVLESKDEIRFLGNGKELGVVYTLRKSELIELEIVRISK